MITVFDVIEASTKQPDPQQPSHWKLHLDCNHKPVMSNDEIKNSLVDERYSVNGWKTTMVCPLCAKQAPGSCKYTPIHTMIADPTPLFSRQYNQAQGKVFKSASETPKEEGTTTTTPAQAVSNWWELYNKIPAEQRPAFRKSMDLLQKGHDGIETYVRLFSSDSEVNLSRESQDILKVMKDKLAQLEQGNK